MNAKPDMSTGELRTMECEPCRGGVPPLSPDQQQELLKQLDGWEVVNGHHLSKSYPFPDFMSALQWVNKIGGIAEREGHHPNIFLTWGKAALEIYTHKIDGLTKSDFVLAAKIDTAEG